MFKVICRGLCCDVRLEVIVFRFVDIAGVVDYHCLNFPFLYIYFYQMLTAFSKVQIMSEVTQDN